ncbi:MAG: hypothetical protein POG74_08515 [Acidocella sp.]|nr:hypothetical protein [Acidocella sp.]
MRYIFLLPVLLAACSLPNRASFAPAPVAADPARIAATQAFAGRVPLMTIPPGTADFATPVAKAVHEARAIKPAARFEVQSVSPIGSGPDAAATRLAALSTTAAAVAQAIIGDGVAPENVTLTAATSGTDTDILVYVK